jgi:hypothetical protein
MPETALPADLLPEVAEARAVGEVRRIYGEIKRLSAVPMVALIYRHLATIPGVLEWSWALLEPVMRSGELQRRAWQLAASVSVDTPAMPRAALRAAGLEARDERGIAAVLDAYNRANPVNILAVRCLALHLAGFPHDDATAAPLPAWEPPPAPDPLPPMIDPQAMTATVRELALLLTDRGAAASPSPLWPSLYRHLAHWPAMLGYTSVLVVPRFDAIDSAATSLRAQMDAAAVQLAQRMSAPAGLAAPGAGERERLRRAIGQFSKRIPEMVVIGCMLRRSLPPQT